MLIPWPLLSVNLPYTFHVPNLMSLFHCSGRTKESVQVPRHQFMFRNYTSFYGEEFLAPRPTPPSWRTTPCRLSATVYSIYSWLPSILQAVPPPAPWGSAMSWWQGPTYHGNQVPITMIMFQTSYPWQLAVDSLIPRVQAPIPSHLPNTFSLLSIPPSHYLFVYVNMSQLILSPQSLRLKVCISYFPTRAAYPTNLTLLDFITLVIYRVFQDFRA